jgi:hypothetical protein
MKYVLLITLLMLVLPASAEMYRWVDDNGKVHYSDKPVNDSAKPYEPAPIITVPSGTAGGQLMPLNKPAAQPTKYKSLMITAPANDHVFTPDQTASIAVSVEVKPALRGGAGHQLAVYVDGQLHSQGTQSSFNLGGLPRGTHTVNAVILDAKGKKLKSSDTVSFHVQKHHL